MTHWEDVVGSEPSRARIIRLLRRLEETGATIIVPTTETRGDYVNVLPPSPSRRRGRICSVQIRTGRVEFQTNSWDRLAERRGFDRLDAGNKAARTPHSDADIDAIVAAFVVESASTRFSPVWTDASRPAGDPVTAEPPATR